MKKDTQNLPCSRNCLHGGFYVRHVKGIQMHNVKLRLQEDDFRPAFVFDRVSNVRLSGISLPENKKGGAGGAAADKLAIGR